MLIDITRQKESEAELEKAKHFFEQLYLQSATSTQLLDAEGWCLRINPKLTELFGVKPEDIEGRKYNILQDGEIIRTGVIDKLRRVFEFKEKVEWEVFFDIGYASASTGVKVSEPLKKYFHTIAYPILDDQGELEYVIVQHEDISERKNAEIELRASRKFLSHILQAAPVGIGMVKDRTITFVNQELCRMLGYKENELLGKKARILYPSDKEYERVGKHKYAQLQKKGASNMETRFQCKDGREIDVHMSTTVTNPVDLSEGYVSSVVNITERKKYLHDLEESKNRLKHAHKVAKLGHWSFDPDTRRVTWSEEVYDILGKDPEAGEPSDSEHRGFIHPEDLDDFFQAGAQAIATGKGYILNPDFYMHRGKKYG